MSGFTKRVRQKLGYRAWLKVWMWKLLPFTRPKFTPPKYDEEYWDAMRAFDDELRFR